MTLKELLEKYPEVQIDCLSNAVIEEQERWIEKLEDMIINGDSREKILMEIDNRYWYTIRMQDEGLLNEDEHWYDDYL